MIKLEFVYNLIQPVTINKTQQISSLKFKAPTASQMQYSAKLRQFVMNALMTHAEKNKKTGEENKNQNSSSELTADDGRAIVDLMSGMKEQIDIIEVFQIFKNIAVNGNRCEMDNQQPLTSFVYDEFIEPDIYGMLSAYIANFTLASR